MCRAHCRLVLRNVSPRSYLAALGRVGALKLTCLTGRLSAAPLPSLCRLFGVATSTAPVSNRLNFRNLSADGASIPALRRSSLPEPRRFLHLRPPCRPPYIYRRARHCVIHPMRYTGCGLLV